MLVLLKIVPHNNSINQIFKNKANFDHIEA